MNETFAEAPGAGGGELESRVARHLDAGPDIDPAAWLFPGVVVLGAVTIGAETSLWPGVIVRGDLSPITIGRRCNLQDGVVVHVADEGPVWLGDGVSCGHRAVIHACHIGDECLVGMGAVVMDGAWIGSQCIVAAGAVVPKGMVVPEGHLVVGVPARVARPLTTAERDGLPRLAAKYVRVSAVYRSRSRGCQRAAEC